MKQICFYFFGRPVYWYGVMVALGFLAVIFHWSLLARRKKLPAGFGSDLGFWIMIAGIIGARLAYVAANLPEYLAHPVSIIRIDQGGLIYYGGFIGGVVGVVLFARIRRIPLWSLGDFVMSGLPLGHALGRLGCFLNGCCYGMPTQCLCGVVYPENSAPWYRFGHAPLHPTQLYEAAFNLLLYLFFLWYYPRRRRQGNVVALYLLLYPLARFLNEWLRGDERLKWMGLSLAQEISVLLFLTGLVLWFSLPRNIRRDWP